MENIIDVIVWGGFIYILFIFIRGMNETQVNKHLTKLEENEKRNQKDIKGQKSDD